MASLVIMMQRPTLMVRWLANLFEEKQNRRDGGAGGIRTLDRALQPYNGLANRRLQPLGHVSRAKRRAATYARRLPPLQAPGARAWRALAERGFARPSDDRVLAPNPGRPRAQR